MLGDDPDPTVTIARFGFGEVLDMGEGSMHCTKRGYADVVKCVAGLRTVNGDKAV